ncbi:MAG: DUF4380 domain-containing protein [bacterium]
MVATYLLAALALASNPERSLVMLSRGGVEVGIAPKLAGRIVLFRRNSGPNALLADPATWGPGEHAPALKPDAEWKPYNGHIVWIGPQREWWAHQDLDAGKRDRRDDWPPDPWGEYAPFSVVQASATLAVLAGPPSPVTGLKLRKEVRIEPDGTVQVKVVARNIRRETVRWDLWSNTRLRGTDRVFVELGKDSKLRVEHQSSSPWTQVGLNHAVVDGWFSFESEEPLPAGFTARVAKAFLTPSRGIVAAFGSGQVFVKRLNVTPAAQAAPDQAPVEIFQNVTRDPKTSLLELEAHGAYTALAPNEEMAFEETWTLAGDGGTAGAQSRAALLDTMFPPVP